MPTIYALRGVWFTSATEGWAVGNGGTVLHTLDGGGNWTRLASVGSGEGLRDVYFAGRDAGWVVGTNGQILATSDRGATWSRTWRGGQTLNGVMFAGADGWAVGENGVIVGSHDAGRLVVRREPLGHHAVAAWAVAPQRRAGGRRRACRAWWCGPQPRRTRSPGAWATPGSFYQCAGVCFPTAATGYAVGWNGSAGFVLRSDDGGGTWVPQTVPSAYPLRGVYFVDERRGWAVGDHGVVRHTASGGI